MHKPVILKRQFADQSLWVKMRINWFVSFGDGVNLKARQVNLPEKS